MAANAPDAQGAAGTVYLPILMYHSVSRVAAPRFRRFVVTPEEFEQQVAFLAEANYHTLTAGGLTEAREMKNAVAACSVALTFDDAYCDFHGTVLPIISRYGIRATLFVPTAYVGRTASWLRPCGEERREILSWSALAEVASEGVELAAHSHSHPQLDRLPPDQIKDEVTRSKGLLEDHLGRQVAGMAYPFGYWSPSTQTVIRDAGYRYACAVDDRSSSSRDDHMSLPRLTIEPGLGTAGFARLLTSRPSATWRSVAAAKRRTWRLVRRTIPPLGGDPREGHRRE